VVIDGELLREREGGPGSRVQIPLFIGGRQVLL
jgi:hypothetical protein